MPTLKSSILSILHHTSGKIMPEHLYLNFAREYAHEATNLVLINLLVNGDIIIDPNGKILSIHEPDYLIPDKIDGTNYSRLAEAFAGERRTIFRPIVNNELLQQGFSQPDINEAFAQAKEDRSILTTGGNSMLLIPRTV